MPDDLVQQLGEVVAQAWLQAMDDGEPTDEAIARAVLASGLVVPTDRHEQMAQAAADWRARHDHLLVSVVLLAVEFDNAGGTTDGINCAAELRALTQQEPR